MCDETLKNRINKWATGISDLRQFILDAEHRKSKLTDMLSKVDREITDINHYIELNNLNAYKGWLMASMLKEKLQKRRKIKDELFILTQLGECKITPELLADVNAAISKLEHRTYIPRVLSSLFE